MSIRNYMEDAYGLSSMNESALANSFNKMKTKVH